MKDIILTMENYSSIYKVMQDVKERAFKSEFEQSGEFINIVGSDAIEKFSKEFHITVKPCGKELKTDNKTGANVLPYIFTNYHFDARDNKGYFSDRIAYKYLCVSFEGVLMGANFNWHENKAVFRILGDRRRYSDYLPYDYGKNFPEPNKVGVLTDKKVRAWKDWLLKRESDYLNTVNERENKVNAFLQDIKSIDPESCQIYNVTDENGRIVKNGIEFTYKINNGEIRKNISFHYSVIGGGLDVWKELASGTYNKVRY